jgi:hypothetical protein
MNLLTAAAAATDDVLARASVLDHEKLFDPPAAAGDARQAVRAARPRRRAAALRLDGLAEEIAALLVDAPWPREEIQRLDRELAEAHRAAIAADLARLVATMNRALAEGYEPAFAIVKAGGRFAPPQVRVTREY